jgi:hypothetical protein
VTIDPALVADLGEAEQLRISRREIDNCLDLVVTRRRLQRAYQKQRLMFALALVIGVLSFALGRLL